MKQDQRLFFLLHQAHRVTLREVNRVSETEMGAPFAQIGALFALEEQGNPIGDIGKALRINKTATSDLVARMEAAGLVSKERASNDGRSQIIRATQKGRDIRDNSQPFIDELNQRIRGDFSDQEIEVVSRFLSRLVDGL